MELDNPTAQEFRDANPHRSGVKLPIDELARRVNELRYLDPARISFMSTYPVSHTSPISADGFLSIMKSSVREHHDVPLLTLHALSKPQSKA